jgi:hypothetical protein
MAAALRGRETKEEIGQTQADVEASARYINCSAIMVTEEFLQKVLGPERLKAISLKGMYVVKLLKPTAFMAFFCGASAAWIPDIPGCAYRWVYSTAAERSCLSSLLAEFNSDWRYTCRIGLCHLDLKEGAGFVHRRPSDEEIASIHAKHAGKDTIQKELFVLDRRRLHDAEIFPPPDRCTQSYIRRLRKSTALAAAHAPPSAVVPLTTDTIPSCPDENLFGEGEEVGDPAAFPKQGGTEPTADDAEADQICKKRRVRQHPHSTPYHVGLKETLLQIRRRK